MSNQATRLSNCPADRLAHCRGELATSTGGELKELPQRKTGSPSLSNHRSYNEGFNTACDKWDPHVTRLQAEVSALQHRLNVADQQVCDLEKDKQRLDALESNFWDVRHHSAPLAETGDYTGGVEIVGRWMDKPHERVIGEDYNESLRAAIDQAMSADAYPPARPEYPEIDAALSDDDWHMNPCKQGHRDVGACQGTAFCHTCDETITASTTQEAFEQWNATHPAAAQ